MGRCRLYRGFQVAFVTAMPHGCASVSGMLWIALMFAGVDCSMIGLMFVAGRSLRRCSSFGSAVK